MKKITLIITVFLITLFNTAVIKTTYADTKITGTVKDSADSAYARLPACIRLFVTVLKCTEEYNIPMNIAFGLAFYESGYKGPLQVNYNPKLTSKSNAYGAMQIKVKTANYVSDTAVSKFDLLNNLELNVRLSLKLLSLLKNQYGSWALALGAYNTGKPVVNKYAKNIVKFKSEDYFKWNQYKN